MHKAVHEDSKKRRTNLAMVWIDYQKAYDSIPHSWVLRARELHGVNRKIIRLIGESMNQWNTQLTACGKDLANIPIMSGIFQGDSLSLLLFYLALNTLSTILNQTTLGYICNSAQRLNHLQYVDGLKLYTKTENQLKALVSTVDIFKKDISMKFGVSICAKAIEHR